MKYTDFAEHYERTVEPSLWRNTPADLPLVSSVHAQAGTIGEALHDVLAQPTNETRGALGRVITAYSAWVKPVVQSSQIQEASAHPEAWKHLSALTFLIGSAATNPMVGLLTGTYTPEMRQAAHMMSQDFIAFAGYQELSMRLAAMNTPGGTSRYYSRPRFHAITRGARERQCSRQEAEKFLVDTGELPAIDETAERRGYHEGLITDMDAMVVTLDAIRPWPQLTTCFAPPQFEAQAGSNNVDILIFDTNREEVIGAQVKSKLNIKDVGHYNTDLMFFIDGDLDLGNWVMRRVEDESTRELRVNMSGLISTGYMSELLAHPNPHQWIQRPIGTQLPWPAIAAHRKRILEIIGDYKSTRQQAMKVVRQRIQARLALPHPTSRQRSSKKRRK